MNNILNYPLYLNPVLYDNQDFIIPITPNPKIYFNNKNNKNKENNVNFQIQELINIKENLNLIKDNFKKEIDMLKNKLNNLEKEFSKDKFDYNLNIKIDEELTQNSELKEIINYNIKKNSNLDIVNFLLGLELNRLILKLKDKASWLNNINNENLQISKEIVSSDIILNKKIFNIENNKKINNYQINSLKFDLKLNNRYNTDNDKINYLWKIFLQKVENKRLRKIYKSQINKKAEFNIFFNNLNK